MYTFFLSMNQSLIFSSDFFTVLLFSGIDSVYILLSFDALPLFSYNLFSNSIHCNVTFHFNTSCNLLIRELDKVN